MQTFIIAIGHAFRFNSSGHKSEHLPPRISLTSFQMDYGPFLVAYLSIKILPEACRLLHVLAVATSSKGIFYKCGCITRLPNPNYLLTKIDWVEAFFTQRKESPTFFWNLGNCYCCHCVQPSKRFPEQVLQGEPLCNILSGSKTFWCQ